MKYLLIILSMSILLSGELEVDGNLKVTGTVESTTIDSLNQRIADLELIIAQLQAQMTNLLTNSDCSEAPGIQFLDVCGICGGDAESEDDCNYALYFDGNSNFVDLTNTTIAIQGSNPRTIMAWVKTIGNNDDDMKIISTGNTETSAAFNILINDQGVINVMGYSNDYYTNTGISVNNNIWNHIAVTYNGTEVKIYINGEFDHGTNKSWNTNSQENYIGKSNHFDTEGTADYYKGLLDDISVWDYAFEPSDIQLYLNAMPSGDESGLVGYWNFNEGSDNILNDLSGNENHGTIHGATWVNR